MSLFLSLILAGIVIAGLIKFLTLKVPDSMIPGFPNEHTPEEIKKQELLPSITVNPKPSQRLYDLLEERYARKTPDYFANYSKIEIFQIRREIVSYYLSGSRSETITKMIAEKFKILRNEAKVIALNETTLFMNTFHQARYMDAGIMEYRWTCVKGSPKYPVCPSHKALDGQIFRWDAPPVVNEWGERWHPGEQEGCRCYAFPIADFLKGKIPHLKNDGQILALDAPAGNDRPDKKKDSGS